MNCVYDSINNCIYMAGSFWGNMILDADTVNGNVYFNNFIAKMDLIGNFQWAKNAWIKNNSNLTFNDRTPVIYVNNNGILYVTTSVIDSAIFDNFTVPLGGSLAKFDSNGNCISVRHLFSDNVPPVNLVLLKFINNDLIMYGGFQQSFQIDTANLLSNGNSDIFISRADSNGNITWLKQYGTISNEGIRC